MSKRDSFAADAAKKKPDLHVSRVFDAPRRLVFEAWSRPEHLSKWLPPRAFTMAWCEMEFRAGGVFRFAFRGPDGNDYPFEGAFHEIVQEERIVYVGTLPDDLQVCTTVTFEDLDGKTKLTATQVYSHVSPATRGGPVGWSQTLDQLADYLAR